MLGVGYSIWLTERVTLDASAQYTLRTEAHDFKVGDRIDTGAAVAYRLTDDPKEFPRTSVFGELNGRRLFQSESNGQRDPNSGGYSIFVSAGVKVGFTDNVAWTIALQVPVWQDLNGEQQTTQSKATTGITFSF